MHPFIIVGAVFHATAILVLAFFVLFAASKAEGLVKTLGNLLGGWLVILAVLAIVSAAIAPMHPLGMDFGRMHHGWGPPSAEQQPAPTPPPASPAKK